MFFKKKEKETKESSSVREAKLSGDVFKITSVLKMPGKAMVIGEVLAVIDNGDVLSLGDNQYKVIGIQKGKKIVNTVLPIDKQVTVALEGNGISSLSEGSTLVRRDD